MSGGVIIRAMGDVGEGKSVVLNIIAQALEEKGFKVTRSRRVPTLNLENLPEDFRPEIRLDEEDV